MIQDVEENNRRIAYGSGCMMPFVALLAVIVAGCCACKSIPVSNDRDSTAAHTEWKVDTVREVDSVFVSIKEKGDTVRVETYKYKYVYKNRDVAVHDTVVISNLETVEVPVDVVKEVPQPLSWWQRFSISIGHFSMAVGLIIIGYWSAKKYLKIPR